MTVDPTVEAAMGGGIAGIVLGVFYLLIQACKNRESRCSSICFDMEIRNARQLRDIHRTITTRSNELPEV